MLHFEDEPQVYLMERNYYAGSTSPATGATTGHGSAETVNISAIVSLCGCMYGSIAILWIIFHRMPANMPRRADFQMALLCVSWASTSVGMHVLNKSLVSVLHAPALISMFQMIVSVLAMVGTSFWRLFEVERKQMLTWMVVPFFFAGMLCSSFYTYEYISLSMLTVVRNLTPLVALPIEAAVMPANKRPKFSLPVIGALLIMLAGAVVYSHGVGGISQLGLIFAIMNMGLALSDRIIQRRLLTTECKDMSSGVCTLVTNFCGMVPTFALAMITGQVASIRAGEHVADWTNPQVIIILMLSGFVGLGIAYLGFECQRAISATAFFVLQNASKIVVVTFGVVFFGDPLTKVTIVGVMLSMIGSFMYGNLQMKQSAEQEAERQPLKKPAGP